MKYLIKRKHFKKEVVFDSEIIQKTGTIMSKERSEQIDALLSPIFNLEIEKIKNGTSSLIKKK